MSRGPHAFGIGVLAASLSLASQVAAQTVRGRIAERDTRAPVPAGIVVLLDGSARAVSSVLTDDDGTYRLPVPVPGRYTVRFERVGFRSERRGPFDLVVGQDLELNMDGVRDGVALRAVRVTADRRCVVRPAEGAVAATLWNEARKALDATRLTAMAQAAQRQTKAGPRFALRIRSTRRELEPLALREVNRSDVESETTSLVPFASVAPRMLALHGYARRERDNVVTYFAPDAEVLLSDEFLDTHCFRAIAPRGGEAEGMIGLAFEPSAPDHDRAGRVDIQGVLWLDRATTELRYLEYNYVNLGLPGRADRYGGLVEFRPLPSGRWIVWRWYIRMPHARPAPRVDPGAPSGLGPMRALGVAEEGGEVLEVVPAVRIRPRTGRVAGTAIDGTRGGRPLVGARVFLSGTSHATVTDSGGAFAFDPVDPGRYVAVLVSSRLDSLMLDPLTDDVAVSADEQVQVALSIPDPKTLIADRCRGASGDSTDSEPRAVIIGTVRDSAGAAAVGAKVRVLWSTFAGGSGSGGRTAIRQQQLGVEVTVSDNGRFTACGVPVQIPVTVRVDQGASRAERGGLRLVPREMRRVDLALRPKR